MGFMWEAFDLNFFIQSDTLTFYLRGLGHILNVTAKINLNLLTCYYFILYYLFCYFFLYSVVFCGLGYILPLNYILSLILFHFTLFCNCILSHLSTSSLPSILLCLCYILLLYMLNNP